MVDNYNETMQETLADKIEGCMDQYITMRRECEAGKERYLALRKIVIEISEYRQKYFQLTGQQYKPKKRTK